MQHRPEDIARHTVEENGGTYTTDVADLLELFGRRQLTTKARSELARALAGVGVGVDPDLGGVQRQDTVRLYLVERAAVAATPAQPRQLATESPSGWAMLRPRTWKGWALYGLIGLAVLGALLAEEGNGGADGNRPALQDAAPDDQGDVERERLERERRALNRERAAVRRERERLKRQARERREQALARRRQERRRQAAEQQRLEEEARQAAPPPASEPAPTAEGCDPNYEPCIPAFPPDLNCPDVSGPVTVLGSDPHGLDADGDGTGCDS